MAVTNPTLYNIKQCNEIRRCVFYESLAKARSMIGAADFDAEKVSALAAIAEACGNDLVSDDDSVDDD